MKQRQAPMSRYEIRLANKHFRLNYTMPEVVALFRDRYTAEEIRLSIDEAAEMRRRQEASRPPRVRKRTREALEAGDVEKRRLIRANDRFAALLRLSGAVEGVVTTPSTKAPIPFGPNGLRFGDSQAAL